MSQFTISFRAIPPRYQSAILLILGLSIFGLCDNFTVIAAQKVGVGQFHFSRSIIACFIVFTASFFLKLSLVPINLRNVLIRTSFNVVSMLLYFGVLPMIPIADAGAGLFTSPIFVLLFSALFFKEQVSFYQVVAIIIGAIGLLLVLQPGTSNLTVFHLAPVLAGACYAACAIYTSKYCKEESPLAMLIIFLASIGLSGLVISLIFTVFPAPENLLEKAPFLFKGWKQTDFEFWMLISFLAFSASIAIGMMIKAYQISEASFTVVYEYFYLISAGFFGFILWDSAPNLYGIIGIIFIIIAGVIISIVKPNKVRSYS